MVFHMPLRSTIALTMTIMSTLAQADEMTLCHQHEEIYFSCSTGNKIVSLCASGNISPSNGYVQYRFGTPDHIELEFPSEPNPPRKSFSISDISGGNLNFVHVRFKSGGYDYVIYQGFPSGVYVKKNGKAVLNSTCTAGVYQQLSQRAYRGIRTTAPIDDVDN
jgi:hypothetical protein